MPVQADLLQDALDLVQPTQFGGTYDEATGAVLLTWQSPDDAQAWSYELYRDGSLLATLTGLSFTDTTATAAATYYTLLASSSNSSSISSTVVLGCEPVVLQIDTDPLTVRPGIRDECLEP